MRGPDMTTPEGRAGLTARLKKRGGCAECRQWAPHTGGVGEVPTTSPGHRHHPSGWVRCACQSLPKRADVK